MNFQAPSIDDIARAADAVAHYQDVLRRGRSATGCLQAYKSDL